MMIKLNPTLPLLWRTPTEFQIGFDPPAAVTLTGVTPAQEHLLGALGAGATVSVLEELGAKSGLGSSEVHALLGALGPALEDHPRPETSRRRRPRVPRWAVLGQVRGHPHPLVRAIAQTADATRLDPPRTTLATTRRPALVVLVDNYVIPPHRYAPWLSEEVPHLAVVCWDRQIRIGPLVEPGRGPCIGCVQRSAAARDPTWASLAIQAHRALATSAGPPLSALAVGPVLAAVHARLRSESRELRAGVLVVDGTSVLGRREQVFPHPECACGAGGPAGGSVGGSAGVSVGEPAGSPAGGPADSVCPTSASGAPFP
ncbi:TOMM precursor leader peptide-binding protein [Mycetocola sp. JXN-3]|uniref:TOMM precursor leader peptide-binding protein n=1 Tax=Mycetocola sp. JXN-3 TaxID=2116510 RepID=UPI00165D171C|nr:TOMM precursor leader peptide-binding protein [Mycetocola sp. JXN-3]